MSDYSTVLDRTDSLCPVCLATIPAKVVERGGKIFLEKTCPLHGPQITYLWPDADHYRWFQAFSLPSWEPVFQTETSAGCPLNCGLCGFHVKHPTVAEIEVKLRCNLRCPVCFMAAGDAPSDPRLETIANMFAAIRRKWKDRGPRTA